MEHHCSHNQLSLTSRKFKSKIDSPAVKHQRASGFEYITILKHAGAQIQKSLGFYSKIFAELEDCYMQYRFAVGLMLHERLFL